MEKMKTALNILSMILVSVCAISSAAESYALPADHYASSSILSTGRWLRVSVNTTGMHLVTDAELRKAGFTDPSKVRVYGRGGRQGSFGYTDYTPDDLPLQPSVRTQKGIVFFAVDHISWKGSLIASAIPYTHDIHAYSHDNYYFLSDRDPAGEAERVCPVTAGGGEPVTEFNERLLHEQELEFGGESGRQIFGEDFRTKRSQTFNFARNGAADDEAIVKVRFAAKNTNGTSTLKFSANGKTLPSDAKDNIASSSIDYYFTSTETVKEIEGLDGNLALNIEYSQTGSLFMARLDYIEVFYRRRLELDKGELVFYGTFSPSQTISVAGCGQSTVIWDVTDPCAPARVDYRLNGDRAEFGVTRLGYREFAVFDPESVSRTATAAGNVANQDLHSLPTPDMLIVTLPEYREGARRIAALHEETDGFRVHVLDAQQIYNEFSGGKADFAAFRNIMKMWYDRGADEEGHRIGYCLLMGRPFYDNKMVSSAAKGLGYTPMPTYESYDGNWEHTSYSTDDLIGHLEDVEDDRYSISSAALCVAVGRLPVTTSKEALEMAEKIEKYVKTPDFGSWRNKIMIIADDDDRNDHLNQAQDVYKQMRGNGAGYRRVYDRIYLDSYERVMTGIGATYPQATERMMRNYNDGVLFTNYIGHGSPVGWCHEHLWEWESITSMTNRRLTFILAATCRFAPWDESTVTGGEKLLLNPDAGAIGLMTTSRTVYVDQNGRLNKSLSTEFFKTEADGRPRRFGDVFKDGKNGFKSSNSLRYIFMGDPALRIPGGASKVEIATINGTDITLSDTALPELTASSSAEVEGSVLNPDGSVNTDFNGTVTLDLYDAERVITTLGQGSTGFSISYNDRDKRLSSTTARVTAGRWNCVLRVPPEIQGNYSPAMIAAYAWSDNGEEANGNTEHLYVYGFNNSADTDTVPPVIEKYYVNSPNFTNGGVVNSNPMVFARLRDESGINISDSGIGHSMTITIDDSRVVSGLNTYFEQDPDDPDAGSLAFPLEGIEAGRHKLTLTVWDNANNVSKASIDVNIGAAMDPVIYDITASATPTYVDFRVSLDRPNTTLTCETGIFDLNGRRVWSESRTLSSDMESTITSRWDFSDQGGNRVPRGIYIYRVRVETPEGTYTSKSKKIAVAAAAR